MRIRRFGSLLLALAMVVSLLTSGFLPISAQAADGSETDPSKGMNLLKKAELNDDGTYKITLEAFATGAKFSSESTKDVPTDIILVLDQSGSMKENFLQKGETKFVEYTDKTNGNLYSKRYNGGSENLYHKLNDNTYVTVSVEAEYGDIAYVLIPDKVNIGPIKVDRPCVSYLSFRDNMFVKINGVFKRVETAYNLFSTPHYHYYVDGQVVATGNSIALPSFVSGATDDSKFYTSKYDESRTKYTYSYTDDNGDRIELGTSTGINGTFANPPLYQKTTTSNQTITRLAALQKAVTQFQDSVAKKAMGKDGIVGGGDDIDHRVAIVGFACSNTGSDSKYNNYQNTEIFIGADGHKYGADANANTSQALQDMSTSDGQKNVTDSIGALEADGATYVNHGMELANKIWENDPKRNETDRKRVVIVFTDGVPGYSGYDSTVAANAIDAANTARNTYKADVYTVGIFDGANANDAGSASGNDTQKANYFMQNMSNNLGSPRNPSYYLSANDSDSLTSIFKQIADNIESGGSSTTLGEKTVIKDLVSDYFQLPAGTQTTDITVQTVPCTGITNNVPSWGTPENFSGAKVAVDADTGSVSVSGFDFAKNYVGIDKINGNETPHTPANKLVISFNVTPKAGFLGGNGVPTNSGAYIYENETATEPVLKFNEPTVDVPIKEVTVNAPDKNVYLLRDVTVDSLKQSAEVKVGDVKLDLTKPNGNWGLEAWQTEYVTISAEVKGGDGGLTGLTDDQTYTVAVTVSPSNSNGNAQSQAKSAEGKINVFKPTLTFQDSEADYGANAPTKTEYDNTNFVSESWLHNGVVAPEAMGDAPILDLTYTPSSGITDDKITGPDYVPVNVDVTILGTNIDRFVTFAHKECTVVDSCVWDSLTKQNGDPAFLLHLKSGNLTIIKTGSETNLDPAQGYIFDVTGPNGLSFTVSVKDNGRVTIANLPVGEYAITERESWSWRYTAESYTLSHQITLRSGENEVTVKNERDNQYLLDGNAYAQNNAVTSVTN